MSDWQHEEVVVRRGPRSGITMIVAIHSTALGVAAGGCRMWTYPAWRDGLDDALRLSEAMTLKCALAGLPHGGGKSVIALAPGTLLDAHRRRDVMLDLGDLVESLGGRYGVAEDVGTTAEDMLVASERTRFAYCLPEREGGSGEPSEPTAVGVHAAIRATCRQLFDDPSPAGRRFALIGLGQVGSRLAKRLADEGGVLTVTDTDLDKKALADELGATWVDPAHALEQDVDIVIPAALGGLLSPENVSRLRCSAVVGPANNQLTSPHVADLLAGRGILWAPDFLVNAGGVVFGALTEAHGISKKDAMIRVADIGATLEHVFRTAEQDGLTSFSAASAIARRRVEAAGRR